MDNLKDPLDFQTPGNVLPWEPREKKPLFTITTDSYISLCSLVYADICSRHPGFKANISESAFQYYAVIILWKRFADILPTSFKEEYPFFDDIAQVSSPLRIPIPLLRYLKGIGNFYTPDGVCRKFLLPVEGIPRQDIAEIRYTFGKVTACTHCYYEAFPAPAIVILRMLADIDFTKNNCNKIWDLPKNMRPHQPAEVRSLKPTKNLLGWAPAQKLTDKQQKLFESFNIKKHILQRKFFNEGTGLTQLLEIINKYIITWEKSDIYRADKSGPLSQMGSQVQGVTVGKENEDFGFDRSAMYCEGELFICSPYKLNKDLKKSAIIAGYRMAKKATGDRNWSCYDFDGYKSVPNSWFETRNVIYNYGSLRWLDHTLFITQPITKKLLQHVWIERTVSNRKVTPSPGWLEECTIV